MEVHSAFQSDLGLAPEEEKETLKLACLLSWK